MRLGKQHTGRCSDSAGLKARDPITHSSPERSCLLFSRVLRFERRSQWPPVASAGRADRRYLPRRAGPYQHRRRPQRVSRPPPPPSAPHLRLVLRSTAAARTARTRPTRVNRGGVVRRSSAPAVRAGRPPPPVNRGGRAQSCRSRRRPPARPPAAAARAAGLARGRARRCSAVQNSRPSPRAPVCLLRRGGRAVERGSWAAAGRRPGEEREPAAGNGRSSHALRTPAWRRSEGLQAVSAAASERSARAN